MKSRKIQERFLYKIWKNQLQHSSLKAQDGKLVEIIDPGVENHDNDGPDFINARVQIGNIKFQGDIEIDNSHSDWNLHGHNFNKNYNKVILHVIFKNDPEHKYVISRSGRKIPNVSICDFLSNDLRESIQSAISQERNARLNVIPCFELSDNLTEDYKTAFIRKLGKERFQNKCKHMLNRLKEMVYLTELDLNEPIVNYEMDEHFHNKKLSFENFSQVEIWEQLFYESIFEALGYSRNKEIMRKIAQSVNLSWLKGLSIEEDYLSILESIIFNISGLIPQINHLPDEETSTYVRKLIEIWSNIKNKYDEKIFNKTHWHFTKLRPPNFPAIRLSGGIRILNRIIREDLINNILKKFQMEEDPKLITRYLRDIFIVQSEGFWQNHYVFEKKGADRINYFIGLSRADEIIINVVFPFASIYFEIFGKREISEKIFSLYSQYTQKSENRIVTNMSNSLNLKNYKNRSIIQQGMIELYRNFCTRDICLKCEIGKQVFN